MNYGLNGAEARLNGERMRGLALQFGCQILAGNSLTF
jgi:hypothetical protein